MRNKQTGFTMIELIVVIVILGILAATALPKFIDLSSDANASALKGMAGQLGGAMTTNYAGCAAVSQVVTAGKCIKVSDCGDVTSLIQGTLPTEYTVTAGVISTTNGLTSSCTVVQTSGASVNSTTFTGIAAGN